MEIIIFMKFLSLMIAIWFTTVNMAKFGRGHEVNWINFAIMSFSITMFVFLQFGLFR